MEMQKNRLVFSLYTMLRQSAYSVLLLIKGSWLSGVEGRKYGRRGCVSKINADSGDVITQLAHMTLRKDLMSLQNETEIGNQSSHTKQNINMDKKYKFQFMK